MKKIIMVGAILLLLASCVTQRKCFEKFPPQIITKDSVVFKDTTIYVKQKIFIPGDTVSFTDTIPCPDVQYHKVVKSTSGRTTAKVDIEKGKLSVDCQVDSLNKVIDSLKVQLQMKESYHSEVKVVEKPTYKIPAWGYALIIAIGVVAILLILKKFV